MAVEMYYTPRKLNDIMAHKPYVRRAIKVAAEARAASARSVLAVHRSSGGSDITITSGSLDYFVNLEDNSAHGGPAAAAIEFGHVAANGRFVDGIHALTGGIR